jgi:hypothetical protein
MFRYNIITCPNQNKIIIMQSYNSSLYWPHPNGKTMVQSNSLFLFSYGDKDKETKKLDNKFVIQNMAPTCINYWNLLFLSSCIVASFTLS